MFCQSVCDVRESIRLQPPIGLLQRDVDDEARQTGQPLVRRRVDAVMMASVDIVFTGDSLY